MLIIFCSKIWNDYLLWVMYKMLDESTFFYILSTKEYYSRDRYEVGRGKPEPTTSYQQPATYQQLGSSTCSGSANKISGLVTVLAEKYWNAEILLVLPASCW